MHVQMRWEWIKSKCVQEVRKTQQAPLDYFALGLECMITVVASFVTAVVASYCVCV